MPIELKQSLKLSQQLVLTPQLQQAIKLLQLSRFELSELIQDELLENPVLEEAPQAEEEEVPDEVGKEIESEPLVDKVHETQHEVGEKDGDLKEPTEFDWENYIGTYSYSGEEARSFTPDEQPNYENMVTKKESLQEHLEWQLRMTELLDIETEIGLDIIGALNEDGYLTLPLEEIAKKNNYDPEQVEDILEIIQGFDPIGVGARDLKECLLLQAKKFGKERELLEVVIKDHLPLLQQRDFETLARKLKIPLNKIIEAAKIVSEMEPKPGRPYGGDETHYIIPDVYVYKLGQDYAVVLNEEGLPRLRISQLYRDMLSNNQNKEKGKDNDYVQDKLKGAMWLIKSIHQRQRTLYRVSKCIVKFQKEFFDKGIDSLKPMILRDVAEEIGVHESTVSRATSNKYIHTPQGIFELKYFFNSGVSQNSGLDIATETVKEKIKSIVASEVIQKPYSDKEIVDMLKKANIDVARRTVAKYREMLGILPSSKRKQFYPR